MPLTAEIITIGSELLTGLTVNTNAAFIGERLTAVGAVVRAVVTVDDAEADIRNAVETALSRADRVVCTGGLGPTNDDVTKKAVAACFGRELVLLPEAMDRIEAAFRAMGRDMAPANRLQALIPEGAEPVPNRVGQAPGFILSRDGRELIVLPGVPSEMRAMMDETVIPRLRAAAGTASAALALRTAGLPESDVGRKLEDFPSLFPDVRVGFYPDSTGVTVRLMTFGSSAEACESRIRQAGESAADRLGRAVYGTGGDSLESVIGRLLAESGRTLAVAESCTGGLISHRITNVAGSSAYFIRGVVAYHNSVKTGLLGVPESVLQTAGAVSAECAAAMAEGVRTAAGTDFGLSATGIAGPGGGTEEKPVGLVFIGCADASGTVTEKHRFLRERLWNKERSATAALDLLRRRLRGFA
ncbi:MAG: competence/damage-inducible protein A [bacterium]|nr:competence/damage-inducible protein A [bacterium]